MLLRVVHSAIRDSKCKLKHLSQVVPIQVEIRNHGAQAPKFLSQFVFSYSNAYFACS